MSWGLVCVGEVVVGSMEGSGCEGVGLGWWSCGVNRGVSVVIGLVLGDAVV